MWVTTETRAHAKHLHFHSVLSVSNASASEGNLPLESTLYDSRQTQRRFRLHLGSTLTCHIQPDQPVFQVPLVSAALQTLAGLLPLSS